jgi:hypothetical protein
VQNLVQQGVERNFQAQTVGQTLGFDAPTAPALANLPGGARPQAAPAPVAPAPAPTPNYLPTPPAAAAAQPAAAPTPTPSAYGSPPPQYPSGGVQTPPGPVTPATNSNPGLASPPGPQTSGAQTPPSPVTPATSPTPGLAPPPGPQTSGTSGQMAGGGIYSTAMGASPAPRPGGPDLQAQYQAAAAAYTNSPSAWTNQQLSLNNQARENYLNYGKAAQTQQTAAIAGQSRDTSGTGFSSIEQHQALAGQ